MKFGGSSLANAAKIKNAARIIQRFSPENKIVVVASAMNDTTDQLLEMGELARKGDSTRARKSLAKIQKLHVKAARATSSPRMATEALDRINRLNRDLEKTVEGISHLRELTPRSRDYLLSFGERLSTPILAAEIRSLDLKAHPLTGAEAGITSDEKFGEAKPLKEVTYHQVRRRLDPMLAKNEIPVVTGFIAATVDGSITTLGRGGSDYTASLLGAALNTDEIWIWTDVDGLMTADPRIVKDARVLRMVSFGEALELSYFGAKMMHPRAMQPAAQRKIPVRIRNSSKPTLEGTLVSSGETENGERVVKAVSIIRSVGIVTVSGTGMIGSPGAAAKVFMTMGSNNVNVMMISQGSSEATISCVVARKDVDTAVRALQLALLGQGYVDKVVAEKDACILAVVGSGMKGTPGVAARIFGAVARKKINVRIVAQGSSEYNVSFVVSEHEGPEAVRVIHDEFQLGRINTHRRT
jgi:aspartate kinase